MRRRARGAGRNRRARGHRLLGDDRALGHDRTDRLTDGLSGQRAGGCRRSAGLGTIGLSIAGPQPVDQRLEAPDDVRRRTRQLVHDAPGGHEVALLAGIGEERHGGLRVDQDQVFEPRELYRRELRDVREAFDRLNAGAALKPRGEDLAEQLRAGGTGDASGCGQRRFAQRAAAEQNGGPLACAERIGGGLDRGFGGDRWIARCSPAPPEPLGRPVLHSTTRPPEGSAWPPRPAGRSPPPPPRRRRAPARKGCRMCAPSSRRCGRPSRCQTAAARRIACDRSRGRRRC